MAEETEQDIEEREVHLNFVGTEVFERDLDSDDFLDLFGEGSLRFGVHKPQGERKSTRIREKDSLKRKKEREREREEEEKKRQKKEIGLGQETKGPDSILVKPHNQRKPTQPASHTRQVRSTHPGQTGNKAGDPGRKSPPLAPEAQIAHKKTLEKKAEEEPCETNSVQGNQPFDFLSSEASFDPERFTEETLENLLRDMSDFFSLSNANRAILGTFSEKRLSLSIYEKKIIAPSLLRSNSP